MVKFSKFMKKNSSKSKERITTRVVSSSSKLKLKKAAAKGDIIEMHGGRIVRSTGRKDRHSKVCTARGPRDRRVRLSPNTAIQFYDVQDRLGYDRPSKAIDWLMKEAKSAIDALDDSAHASQINSTILTQTVDHQNQYQSQLQYMNCNFFLPQSSAQGQHNQGLNCNLPLQDHHLPFVFGPGTGVGAQQGVFSNALQQLPIFQFQEMPNYYYQREPLQSSFSFQETHQQQQLTNYQFPNSNYNCLRYSNSNDGLLQISPSAATLDEQNQIHFQN
ncbi:hypothetical protein M9H77_26065 [Catharanthus roseus]|uniref:Uncharacterized protein n=2 Tax=Catharanthus roseus TaxID=4058 RepID=A0ACC0ABC1_CATRO|nr:hypothetical protein M9H77_26065 [Catharanthus roseus]QTJ02260.1 TCP type transcription factor [Catharanthus roseus]